MAKILDDCEIGRDQGKPPLPSSSRRSFKYVKIVEWSEEDNCFIGSCPDLFNGGCHGPDAKRVFAELCEIVEETIQLYEQDGRPLPDPMSGRDFVNAMSDPGTLSQGSSDT